ncbi:MAG: hypothetical protein H7240_06425 [Glaciimonas sp.]|nr:hypothetical protein [Glaciimonas sp.]
MQIGAPLPLKSGMSTRRYKDGGWEEGCKVRSSTTADFTTILRLRHLQDNQWREALHGGADLQQHCQERFRTPPMLAAAWTDARLLDNARLAFTGAAIPIACKSRRQVACRPLACLNNTFVVTCAGQRLLYAAAQQKRCIVVSQYATSQSQFVV